VFKVCRLCMVWTDNTQWSLIARFRELCVKTLFFSVDSVGSRKNAYPWATLASSPWCRQGCICRGRSQGVEPLCTQQLTPWIQLKMVCGVHFNPPYSLWLCYISWVVPFWPQMLVIILVTCCSQITILLYTLLWLLQILHGILQYAATPPNGHRIPFPVWSVCVQMAIGHYVEFLKT